MKPLLISACIFMFLANCGSAGKSGKSYYIDAVNGNDNNSGTSEKEAWKTVYKISTLRLKAGDAVLLKAGQVHQGTIHLKKLSGQPELPLVLTSYGDGRAIIDSGDSLAIKAEECSYMTCKNIVLRGAGRLNGNITDGLMFQQVHHGVIDSVEASGYLMSGIHVVGGSNLRITHSYAHDNGFCGILAESGEPAYGPPDGKVFKTLKQLYIGYSVAENNPGCPVITDNHSGNGILIAGVTNGIIEYCEAMNNGWDMPREGNGPVGIWAYMSDSVIIQHCFSHHNKTSLHGKDGGGFDFDGGMRFSLMQYNLSAFNEGGGYGIFQYAGATSWTGNTVRYNISYHDGSKNSHAGIFMWCDPAAIPMKNFHAYNNTVVNRYELGVNFEPGAYENFIFENNIFLVTVENKIFVGGDYTLATFNHNLYWSLACAAQNRKQPRTDMDTGAVIADPLLLFPNDETLLFSEPLIPDNLEYFKLLPGSPAIHAGKIINNNGGYDYWGNGLPAGMNPNMGAWQGN